MQVRSLIGLTLRRPITVFMVFCTTVLIGVLASKEMPLELLPSGFVNTDISINIPVPDSNPEEVEEQVTKPTVETLRQIGGLKDIRTRSSKNSSRISISFERGRDPDEAFAEIRDLMETAKLSWPDNVQEYFTFRFNVDTDLPVFSFGVTMDRQDEDTAFLVDEKIIKELESVDGVARVGVWGLVDETVRIWIDRDRARARGISIYEVAQALGQDNLDVSGGRIQDGGRFFYVRSQGRFNSLEEIRKYPVKPGVELGQIAEIGKAKTIRNFVFRLNDSQSLWIWINKEASANTVDVCRRIKEKLQGKIMKDPRLTERGWEWYVPELRDFGYIITSALETLVRSALIGGLLAILPLLFFLRRLRPTVIITAAIPSSLLITLGTIYFTGGTLNILSMLGITIAIGMLVDNSIVVVENIDRHRDNGASPGRAALQGTSEVALAITLATLTTVAAFFPLVFMNENQTVSFFTQGIGLPVCYAVLSSLFVALVFIPLTTVLIGRKQRPTADSRSALGRIGNVIAWPFDIALRSITAALERGLRLTIRYRFYAFVIGIAIPMMASIQMMKNMGQSSMVDESGGNLSISVDLESNYTLRDSYAVFQEISRVVQPIKEELGVEYTFYWFSRNGGQYNIGLSDRSSKFAKAATARLRSLLPKIAGAKIRCGIERQNEEKSGIQLRVWGDDIDRLRTIADDLAARLENVPDVESVKTDLEALSDEIIVEPDRERMQSLGVDPMTFFGSIQYGIRGQRIADYQSGDRKLPMLVEYDDRTEPSAADLLATEVWTRNGAFQPMANLAKISYRKGTGSIRKVNGKTSVQLTVDTNVSDKSGLTRNIRKSLMDYPLPEGYSFTDESSDDLSEDTSEMIGTALLSCVLVALLMGILFESFHLPLSIIVSVFFGIVGGAWFLKITNTPLDMLGLIGAVVLVGIVVNNGIVLLDGAHRLRKRGVPREEALIRAGQTRVRPILMTAATTVVGLMPMAMIESSGSFVSYKALARGVMGGLIISTFSTILLVPMVYTLLDDLSQWIRRLMSLLARGR